MCGNGKVETGEACDDGNTVFGDSCSPTCTNICETCEKNVCGGPTADTLPDYENCYGDGLLPPNDVAKTGPKAGTKKNVLCPALVACLKRTNCAGYDSSALLAKCYCGSASAADCALPGMPNGACAEEIAAAGESRTFVDLAQRQKSPQYALGLAALNYGSCDAGFCANECVLGKSQTECQKCTAVADPTVTATCFVNPKGDSTVSAAQCSAAVECAHATRCALNGIPSCYGVVSSQGTLATPGPCATELTAAAGGLNPSQLAALLLNPSETGTISAIARELGQELDNCLDVCFPTSSGGGGNGGSGNAGGGGKGGTSGTGG